MMLNINKFTLSITRKLGNKTFSSLKIYNYRLYFIGQAISLSGTWMQTIGQSWLVLKITNSGTALGLVTAAQFLPILIFGPFGGVIADRYPKRTLLIFTQTVSTLLAFIFGILIFTNLIKLWMIYLMAIFLGFVNVIDNPTRQIFALEMVGKDQLANAITLNSAEINLARVIGPTLAGILIATIGISSCFILNGFSYFAVLVGLFLMKTTELHRSPVLPKMKGQLGEGFRYIAANPILLRTLIMMVIIGTFSYEFIVTLPLLADFTFHGNAGVYAALTSAMGIGSIIGAFYTANRKITSPYSLIISAFLFGIVLLITAIAPTLSIALICLALIGIFSINFTTIGNVTLQLESIPEMRGRVMALWTVAFLGSTPIGGPIIGWIGEHIGPRWSLAVGGFAAIVAASIGLLTLQKELKKTFSNKVQIVNLESEVENDHKIF